MNQKNKIRKFCVQEDFLRETLEIRKILWDEVTRLTKRNSKFAMINCECIYL